MSELFYLFIIIIFIHRRMVAGKTHKNKSI